MFLVNLGSFWILSFVFCRSFLLCFWVASARFSGISVFVGPCFLKINFVQHWQSLSAVQNFSSKTQAPQNLHTNPEKIFSGCLTLPPTSYPLPPLTLPKKPQKPHSSADGGMSKARKLMSLCVGWVGFLSKVASTYFILSAVKGCTTALQALCHLLGHATHKLFR